MRRRPDAQVHLKLLRVCASARPRIQNYSPFSILITKVLPLTVDIASISAIAVFIDFSLALSVVIITGTFLPSSCSL